MTATHNGHCQICDRLQAVTARGNIAKHGYTTRWGFFEGVCPGSDRRPYEIACDAIQDAINRAVAKAASLREAAAELRQRDDTSAVWINAYVKGRDGRSAYQWVQRAIRVEGRMLQQEAVTERWTLEGRVTESKWERLDVSGNGLYDHEKGGYQLHRIAKHLNSRFADVHLKTAAQCDEYVVWATPRITNWKLAPLTPRKG